MLTGKFFWYFNTVSIILNIDGSKLVFSVVEPETLHSRDYHYTPRDYHYTPRDYHYTPRDHHYTPRDYHYTPKDYRLSTG